jgi:hypothetical protein
MLKVRFGTRVEHAACQSQWPERSELGHSPSPNRVRSKRFRELRIFPYVVLQYVFAYGFANASKIARNLVIRALMKKILLAVLASLICPSSHAASLTYHFDVLLGDAFGSLPAGTMLSGAFSFDSTQSGTDIVSISNAKRFELSGLNLSDGTDAIDRLIAPGQSDAWLAVGDDSPSGSAEDFFTVRAEGSPAFTGTLGGLAVDFLYLIWTDTDGTANNGFALPLNESLFAEYESAVFQIGGSESTVVNGVITNVTLVPLPPSLILVLSGLAGFVGTSRRLSSRLAESA